MSSNSAKMTLEDKVVQHIKDVGMGVLIDDEDAILELVKRAVHAALIDPPQKRSTYGSGWENDGEAIAVKTAREIAKKAADRVTDELVEVLAKDDEFRKKILEAYVLAIPGAINDSARGLVIGIQDTAAQKAFFSVQEHVRQFGRILPQGVMTPDGRVL